MSACLTPDPVIVEIDLPVAPQANVPTQSLSARSQSKVGIEIKLPDPSPAVAPELPEPDPPVPGATLAVPTASPVPLGAPTPQATAQLPPRLLSIKILSPENNLLRPGERIPLQIALTYDQPNAVPGEVLWQIQPEGAALIEDGQLVALQPAELTLELVSVEQPDIKDVLHLSIQRKNYDFVGKIVYTIDQELYLLNGNNQIPQRLPVSGSTHSVNRPRFNLEGTELVYKSENQSVFTLGLQSEAATFQPLSPNKADPIPYFFGQQLYFQGLGDPLFGSSTQRIFTYSNATELEVFNDKLGSINEIGGVTPAGQFYFEKSGQIQRSGKAPAGQQAVIEALGVGQRPKLPLNANPAHYVFDYQGKIYKAAIEGHRTFLGPENMSARAPALSPDEAYVVFVGELNGQTDLFIMKSDGTALLNLTQTPLLSEQDPEWGK